MESLRWKRHSKNYTALSHLHEFLSVVQEAILSGFVLKKNPKIPKTQKNALHITACTRLWGLEEGELRCISSGFAGKGEKTSVWLSCVTQGGSAGNLLQLVLFTSWP